MDELKDRLLLINEGCDDLDYAVPRAAGLAILDDNLELGRLPLPQGSGYIRPL